MRRRPHIVPYPSLAEVEASLRSKLDALARRLKKEAEARGEVWPGDVPGPLLADDWDDEIDGPAAKPLSREEVALGLLGHRTTPGKPR